MALFLCSSPSYLYNDRLNLYNSHWDMKLRRSTFTTKFACLSRYSRDSLRLTLVSLQDHISEEIQNSSSSGAVEPHQTIGKSGFSSPSRHIWVNPKKSTDWQLRQQSYDSRHASLVQIAKVLNSCNPTEEDVFGVLFGIDDSMVEQDAAIVLNNMTNSQTAILALRFFHQKLNLPKKVILYNVTLKVIRNCRDLVLAEKLFNEMLKIGIKPNNITFSTIISCARQTYMYEKAIEWFEKMPKYGCLPDQVTGSIMIDAYGHTGSTDKALSLYERAKKEKWRLDALSFSTVIKIYGASGNFDGCLKVYEEMKSVGVEPNLLSYNAMLEVMGKARQPSQAKSIYNEMTHKGMLPNRATYVALLRAYGRSRYGKDAIIIYKEMKDKCLELNVILYNTLLSMCADIGYIDEAVEIFEDMKSCSSFKPDSWTYSSMLTVYSCSGNVLEAECILNEMLEAGIEPNIIVLTSLIQCYGKANRIDGVVRTVDRLLASGLNPDDQFCGCLLSVMAQLPKDEFGKMTTCIENASARLGRVVRLLLEEEEEKEEDKVKGEFMVEAHSLLEVITPNAKKAFCNCIIELCVKLDLLERASEVLHTGVKLQIYTNLQSRTPAHWHLNLKRLSSGAAITALRVWMSDLSKALDNGEELPSVLGINTGHGKHKYSDSDKVLAGIFESHLKELNAPFHETPNNAGWFFTTKDAATSWIQSRKLPDLVAA